MKNNFIVPVCISILVLFSCNNKADKKEEAEDSLDVVPPTSWIATLNDSTGQLEMKKNETTGPDSLTVSSVIRFLNQQNANVQLQIIKTSNDTVYLKIPEPMYLTQQMGSTGPVLYFASVVYNLTEIPGITHVNFDFEEGDHASPGTQNRESFKQ